MTCYKVESCLHMLILFVVIGMQRKSSSTYIPFPLTKIQFVSIQLIALLEELYKESRGGALDGPVRKSSVATDERASLRGEYENFLLPQTPSDVISTYPLTTQQGVSGGDKNADPDIRICHDISYVQYSTAYV
jgi:hypothetical protein